MPPFSSNQKTFNTEKLAFMSAMALGGLGAILYLAGVCIQQINSNNSLRNSAAAKAGTVPASTAAAFETQWYHTAYYIVVVISFGILSMLSTFAEHRTTLLAFLAIGFVYLTDDLQFYITSARAESGFVSSPPSFTAGGPVAAAAGCVFMILSWFYMLVYSAGSPLFSKK